MSGFDQFAPYTGNDCLSFEIMNCIKPSRIIKIFHHPLHSINQFPENPKACSVNLMKLKGVSAHDIAASLIKGELRSRLDRNEIVILYSNIALFEPDNCQKDFLKNHGITVGVDVGSGGGGGGTVNIQKVIERFDSDLEPHTEHMLPNGLSYAPDADGNGKGLWVYRRALLMNPGDQFDGADYEETSSTSITFYNKIFAGDFVVYFIKS